MNDDPFQISAYLLTTITGERLKDKDDTIKEKLSIELSNNYINSLNSKTVTILNSIKKHQYIKFMKLNYEYSFNNDTLINNLMDSGFTFSFAYLMQNIANEFLIT